MLQSGSHPATGLRAYGSHPPTSHGHVTACAACAHLPAQRTRVGPGHHLRTAPATADGSVARPVGGAAPLPPRKRGHTLHPSRAPLDLQGHVHARTRHASRQAHDVVVTRVVSLWWLTSGGRVRWCGQAPPPPHTPAPRSFQRCCSRSLQLNIVLRSSGQKRLMTPTATNGTTRPPHSRAGADSPSSRPAPAVQQNGGRVDVAACTRGCRRQPQHTEATQPWLRVRQLRVSQPSCSVLTSCCQRGECCQLGVVQHLHAAHSSSVHARNKRAHLQLARIHTDCVLRHSWCGSSSSPSHVACSTHTGVQGSTHCRHTLAPPCHQLKTYAGT
jgi:hypothetical protein